MWGDQWALGALWPAVQSNRLAPGSVRDSVHLDDTLRRNNTVMDLRPQHS